jgi:hypothetical protein
MDLPATPLARVAGHVVAFAAEQALREENNDHFFVTVDAGLPKPVTLSLNTLSYRNRAAGHDARVRLGVVLLTREHLPERGLYPLDFFDYGSIELLAPAGYAARDRREMEEFFAARCRDCRLIEAWGVPYQRAHPGLHQIHSRRASCAVPEDLRGLDGAVRFYFDGERRSELALLKFCGQ